MNNSGNTSTLRPFTSQKATHFLNLMEEQKLELHSVTILQNGQTVLSQGYYPFRPDQLHPVFSCSKSFLSTAVGFLYDEKKLSLENQLSDYFPEYSAATDSLAAQTTLQQLLTMSMGQNYEPVLIPGKDWVRCLLSKRQAWPAGSRFFYASMCTYLLSAVITRITGKTAAQYLDEKLFAKLGILNYYWEEDGMGRNTGGWGLHISTEDMARFGQFLLDRGKANGESLLSEDWIQKATSFQIETAPHYPVSRSENRYGYGYQFWLCSHGAFRASGLYGQLCMIQPENGLVLAVTSAAGGSQPILDAFFKAMNSEDTFDTTLSDRSIIPSTGIASTPYIESIMEQIDSRELPFLDNEFCLEHVTLEFYEDSLGNPLMNLKLCRRGKIYALEAARHCWHSFYGNYHQLSPYDRMNYSTDQVPGYRSGISFASFAWLDECTLEITMRHTDQAARYRILFYFDADGLTMEYKVTELQSDFTYARASAFHKDPIDNRNLLMQSI